VSEQTGDFRSPELEQAWVKMESINYSLLRFYRQSNLDFLGTPLKNTGYVSGGLQELLEIDEQRTEALHRIRELDPDVNI